MQNKITKTEYSIYFAAFSLGIIKFYIHEIFTLSTLLILPLFIPIINKNKRDIFLLMPLIVCAFLYMLGDIILDITRSIIYSHYSFIMYKIGMVILLGVLTMGLILKKYLSFLVSLSFFIYMDIAFLKQLESVRSNLPLLYVLSFYLIIFMVSIFIIYLIILLFERTKYKIKEKLDF